MAFFGIAKPAPGARVRPGASIDFMHRHGCAACPLNRKPDLRSPKLEPSGAARPDIYILGEATTAAEDRAGRHMAGKDGQVLLHHLPREWHRRARWNNCVRTHPGGSPGQAETECCRPSVEQDIAASKPKAILGFGSGPLLWAGITDARKVALWSGRRIPVVIGGHACWYFPIVHPAEIAADKKWRGLQRKRNRYGSEREFRFALDLRAALDAVDAGLPEPIVHSAEDARRGVEWVDGSGGDRDVELVREFLREAAREKIAGFDYETTALRPYGEGVKILTAAVSIKSATLAFPLDHRGARWSERQRREIGEAWFEFVSDPACRKVAHNLSFELEMTGYFFGEELIHGGSWGCTYSQAYVLDERQGASSLEALVMTYFGINIKDIAGVDRSRLDEEPLDKVLQYNGVDAKYHLALYFRQQAALKADGQLALYREHIERVPTAVLTQLKGIPIDQAEVLRLGKKYAAKMADALDELRDLPAVRKFERQANRDFRPSANDDVRYIVNKILGYRLSSVDEEALEAVDHEFVKLELRWRKWAKLQGTYVVPIANEETRAALEVEDAKRAPHVFPDGMIHPLTSVNRTSTSRTSSEDPNYQNWPKRGGNNAIEIRGAVRPPRVRGAKRVIVSYDYGQIQARNVGMESLDDALLTAFWEDYDIHEDFMEQLFRIYPRWIKEGTAPFLAKDDVGKKLRKKYRNEVKHGFVFASFFGAGPSKVSTVLNIPMTAAEELGEIFWDRFGGIKDWHGDLEADYYRTGYVTGHSGYRRHAPVAYNERINAPIQGDEAKIVLDAMTRLSKIDHDYLQASMEIHDDLTFIWEEGKVDELAEIVTREMLTVPFEWAKVSPIVVEMSVGEHWAALKEVGVFASNKYEGIDMPRRRPR